MPRTTLAGVLLRADGTLPRLAGGDPSLRDRLRAVRDQINAARDEVATARTERDAARDAFAGTDMTAEQITEAPEFQAAENAVRRLGEAQDRLADLQQAERGVLSMLGETLPDDRAAGQVADTPLAGWDGGRLVADGSTYQEAVQAGIFSSTSRFGSVVLGQIAARDEALQFLAAIDTATVRGAIPADRRGIVAPILRRLTLLDLIPSGPTDSNSIDYVQVTAVPTGAVEVAELAAKPELALGTVDATAPVRTIAGYVKIARQALDDAAGLATLINTLLPYEVRRRIEAQMIAGDGVGQNLRGLLNTTGIGAPAAVVGDNAADAILRAITVVVLSDGDPNFVALNPLTWQALMLMREDETARTGAYLFGSPSGPAQSIWGLTPTPNRVIPQATPLVGDANGATLLVREGVNVRISDADQDDFTKNRVTVLAEGRVAFPVWRPASFAKATIS